MFSDFPLGNSAGKPNDRSSQVATLEQAFPEQLSDAGLNIAAERRSDGKNMFRIMTAGMSAEEAKQLCSLLWDRMVGCMVKLVP